MTSNARFGFALEYVADIEATKRFYVDLLDMKVEREHPVFIQFKDKQGVAYAIASDEAMNGPTELELYWLVDDADAAYKDLSRKADVVKPLEQLPFGKVFGIKDPAGQTRFLVELAKDRPSQRVN